MDNNNNQPPSGEGRDPEGEKKPGGTLDLQNISIKTLKDDLAEENGEASQDKSGWFKFLAKHKESQQSPVLSPQAAQESGVSASSSSAGGETEGNQNLSTGQADSLLDQELEQFKTESEQKEDVAGRTERTIADSVEAPSNLPISDGALNPIMSDEQENTPGDGAQGIILPARPAGGETEGKQEQLVNDRPALGSFFPPKEPDADDPGPEDSMKNKLTAALSGNTASGLETETTPSIVSVMNSEGDSEAPMRRGSNQISKIEPVPREGISGSMVGDGEEESENANNPFSTRLKKQQPENKSLLQSVESALNYSAPPEFSQEREKIETGTEDDGSGQVVDLRKKGDLGTGGIMKNKKMLIILGGVGGFVVILIIVLALVLGNSNQTKPKTPTPPVAQDNKNQNVNPVPPIKPVTPAPKPAIAPQKFLANAVEINVGSVDAISQELDKIRDGQGVQKQTQLIFLKPDGSTVSFQDLMSATGINIPQKIITQPSSVPALIYADFFKGQTILGLIIPSADTSDLAVSKMKSWESTMVLDLDQLWKGISVDNQGGYFADSKLFSNARFALIDKKSKLSLDYSIKNGYIFIACGRDSMSILQKQFNPPSDSSSGTGIKWEGDSSTTVSGVNNTTTGGSTTNSTTGDGTNSGNNSGGDVGAGSDTGNGIGSTSTNTSTSGSDNLSNSGN